MDLLRTLGRIYQDADQSTSDLINNNIKFAQGQQEDRSIRQDRIEERRKHRRLNLELDAIQRANDLAREVEELQRKVRSLEYRCEVTRDLATDVILDRSSIMSAMKALIRTGMTPHARNSSLQASTPSAKMKRRVLNRTTNARMPLTIASMRLLTVGLCQTQHGADAHLGLKINE